MEKAYKYVPFNIELAKKIESGEIKGRFCVRGEFFDILDDIQIELPEETPKYEFKVGSKVRINLPDEVLQQSMIYGNYQNKILVVKRIINEFTIEVGNSTMRPYCFPPEYLEPVKEIYEFKPFDKVLVRNRIGNDVWMPTFLSYVIHYENNSIRYMSVGEHVWEQCIPYNEETAHLVGTTNKPNEE